jgi:hypothetical protein
MADREVLFREDSTASRIPISIGYRSTNLRFAVVRWPHPRGLPAASEALAGAGGTGGLFGCVSMRAVVRPLPLLESPL